MFNKVVPSFLISTNYADCWCSTYQTSNSCAKICSVLNNKSIFDLATYKSTYYLTRFGNQGLGV